MNPDPPATGCPLDQAMTVTTDGATRRTTAAKPCGPGPSCMDGGGAGVAAGVAAAGVGFVDSTSSVAAAASPIALADTSAAAPNVSARALDAVEFPAGLCFDKG